MAVDDFTLCSLLDLKILINQNKDYTDDQKKEIVQLYSNFLGKDRKLFMFVPCDKNNNPLVKPSKDDKLPFYAKRTKEYEEALDKVWFKGFVFLGESKNTWAFELNGKRPVCFDIKSSIIDLIRNSMPPVKFTKTLIKQLKL